MNKVTWMARNARDAVETVFIGAFARSQQYSSSWGHGFCCSVQDEYDSYVFVYRAVSWGERV